MNFLVELWQTLGSMYLEALFDFLMLSFACVESVYVETQPYFDSLSEVIEDYELKKIVVRSS